MRVLLVIAGLLALAGCGSGATHDAAAPTTPTTTATSSAPGQVYVAYLEQRGIIPTYGDPSTATTLAHQLCDRYARGDSFPAVIQTLTDNGIPAHEAGEINGAATAAFCPQYQP